MARPASVEAYLAGLPEARRPVLERLRATILAAAPGAEETIAYDMPALRLRGQFLVSYAAYSRHFSLFPASGVVMAACGDELRPYVTGKATIQFTTKEPLPDDLVTRVVTARVEEILGRADPVPRRRGARRHQRGSPLRVVTGDESRGPKGP